MDRSIGLFALAVWIGLCAGLTWAAGEPPHEAEVGGLAGLPLGIDLPNTSDVDYGYVRVADDDALEPQTFTIEAWITPLGPGFGGTLDGFGSVIVSKSMEGSAGTFIASFGLGWVSSTGAIYVFVANQLGSSGDLLWSIGTVPMSTSAHVAMTFDGTWLRIFIDGQLDNEMQTTSGIVDYGPQDILIGAGNYGLGFLRRYDGIVDEVRFWDHARDEAEIASQMDCPLFGDEPGLLAYYSFNLGDARDDSGHGHDGVLEGAPEFVEFYQPCMIFLDGFQSGDTAAWSSTVP